MSAVRSLYHAKAAERDLDVVGTSTFLMSGKHQKLLLTRVRSWVKAVDVQAIFGSMQTPGRISSRGGNWNDNASILLC